MPTREQLIGALEKADAAGDQAAANEFATMLREKVYTDPVETVDVPASEALQESGPAYEGPLQQIGKAAQFVGGSVARGLADIPAALIGSLVPPDNFGTLTERPDFTTRNKVSEGITEFVPGLIGAEKPETSGGRVLDAMIRSAAPATFAGKAPALIAALSGLGGQTSAEAVRSGGGSEIQQGVAAVGGSLLAGGGAALLRGAAPRPLGEILADSADDPDALRLSAANAKQARAEGIPMNTLDMMPGSRTKLGDLEQALIKVGGADKTVSNLRAQGPAIQTLANKTAQELPGDILTGEQLTRRTREAATKHFQELGKNANDDFQRELDIAKQARSQQNSADLGTAVDDAVAARQAQATTHEGVAPMLVEEKKAAEDWLTQQRKSMTEQQSLEMARAGREVSNETAFNVDELGNWGTLIMARQALQGGEKRTWTAAQLRERGVDDELIGAMIVNRQPTVKGTGVIATDGPVQTTPTPTREGNVARAIQKSADADVSDADIALAAVQSRIAGQERLATGDVSEAKSRIRGLLREKVGDEELTTQFQWLLGQIDTVRTSKELHNLILGVKKNMPVLRPLNNSAAATSESAPMGKAISILKTLRNKTSGEYELADEAYKAAKELRTADYRETRLGKFAGPVGNVLEQNAAQDAVLAVLRKGESPNVKDSMLRKDLTKLQVQDPELVQTMVKTHLDETLSEVFGSKSGVARPTEQPGVGLTKALGDASNPLNDNRLNGLRIALDVAAKGKNITASERTAMQRGIDRLIEIANANSRTVKDPSAFSPGELAGLSRNLKVLGPALRLIGVAPGSAFARALQDMVGAKTLRELDEMFSNPDKVEMLIALGKQKELTRGQTSMLGMISGMAATRTGEPEE